MIISSLSKQRVWDSERLSDLPEITKLASGSSGTWNRTSWLHYFCTLLPPDQAVHSLGTPLAGHQCPSMAPMHCSYPICVTLQVHTIHHRASHCLDRDLETCVPKCLCCLTRRVASSGYLLLYLFNFLWMYFIFLIRSYFHNAGGSPSFAPIHSDLCVCLSGNT